MQPSTGSLSATTAARGSSGCRLRRRALLTLGSALLLSAATPGRADYPTTLLNLSPLGYWRLNETVAVPAGDRAYNVGSAGSAADGFYHGAVLHPVNGAIATGGNGAASFDGTDGTWVSIANLTQLNPTNAFTVEGWFYANASRPDDTDVACPLASLRRTTTEARGWAFYQLASAWCFRMGNGTAYGVELKSTTAPRAGTWTHLVATFDSTAASLYVNGVKVAATTPSSVYVPNPTEPISIGARGDNAFRFSGMIDEVALYTNALTAASVWNHYVAGLSPSPTRAYYLQVLDQAPVAYYRLGEGPTTSPSYPVAYNAVPGGSILNGRYYPGVTNGVAGPRPSEFQGFSTDNRAAEFHGASGFVGTPHQLNQYAAFTLCGWVRRGTPQTGRGALFGQQGLVEVGEADGGGSLEAYVAALNTRLTTPFPFPSGVWGFVALTAGSTGAVLYTNGVAAASVSGHVLDYGGSTAPFNIGGAVSATAGDWFSGCVDEVAVFRRALSVTEIQALYQAAGIPPRISVQPEAPSSPPFEGNSVTLEVVALGTPPLVYQWRKNGVALPEATASTLTFASVTIADSGDYDVTVSNPYGAATSVVTHLTIEPANPPVILTAPQSRARFAGGQVTFSVEAAGTPPLTYQWQLNGANLAGRTATTLTVAPVTSSDAGSYRVIVRNPLSSSGVESDAAQLTVLAPTRYATAVLADSPLAYWRLGETNGSVANDVWAGHDGEYAGVIQGRSGYSTTDSDPAAGFGPELDSRVTVDSASAFNFTGATPTFTLEAWAKFRTVSGLQRLFSNRDTPGAGYAFGINGSSLLRFTVFGVLDLDSPTIDPPLLAGKWYHLTVVVEDGLVTFYVNGRALGSAYSLFSAILSSPQPFQLGRNPQVELGEQELDGDLDEAVVYSRALAPSRIEAHVAARDDGRVTPAFSIHPAATTVYAGRKASLRAIAEGSAPLQYQWYLNQSALLNATNESLAVALTKGSYSVFAIAVNPYGSARSDSVTVTVEAIPVECDLRDSLVLHLPFDQSLTDISGRGNHGTQVGSPSFVTGLIGTAALDCRTDPTAIPHVFNYVHLGQATDLQFGSNVNFSVAFWAHFGGLPSNLPFLANNDSSTGGPGYAIALSTNRGGWAWSVNDANQPKAWGGIVAADPALNSLNDDRWHHYAFTFDRTGNATTYVDGVLVDETSLRPATNWDLSTTRNILIGQAGGTYAAKGEFVIDDLGVWRRALTAFEVDTIYLVGATLGEPLAPAESTQIDVEIDRNGSQVRIRWNGVGTLETAPSVKGPWTSVSNASSPYDATPIGSRAFFRIRL